MEEGSLRCDANVSIRPKGSSKLGTRVEIKNLNSFRFLQKALDYEIERQAGVLSDNGRIVQETRLWDEAKNRTFTMRTKEEAHDYRYFPEPDLPPLKLNAESIQEMLRSIPELPQSRLERFVTQYQSSEEDALLLTSTRELADYFEETARISTSPRAAANWIMGDLAYALKSSGRDIQQCPVPPATLAGLLKVIDSGQISGKIAKTVFEDMFRSGDDADAVIQRLGLAQISDEASLVAIIEKVKAANPKQLSDYRSGKEKLLAYFVGQVMKETKGQANPQLLNDLLRRSLRE